MSVFLDYLTIAARGLGAIAFAMLLLGPDPLIVHRFFAFGMMLLLAAAAIERLAALRRDRETKEAP
jgi:hypothetical protein